METRRGAHDPDREPPVSFSLVKLPPVPSVISARIRLPVHVPILLPISPMILLTNVGLRQHHSRHHSWGCHSHDQAGNHSGFQHAVLHNSSSLNVREWINLSLSKTVGKEKGKRQTWSI
jgi:hypothetical protein